MDWMGWNAGKCPTKPFDVHCSTRQVGVVYVSILRMKKSASPRDRCCVIERLRRGAKGLGLGLNFSPVIDEGSWVSRACLLLIH